MENNTIKILYCEYNMTEDITTLGAMNDETGDAVEFNYSGKPEFQSVNRLLIDHFKGCNYKIYTNNLDLFRDFIKADLESIDFYGEGNLNFFIQNVISKLNSLNEDNLIKLKLLTSWTKSIYKKIYNLGIVKENIEPFPANDSLKRIACIMFANYKVNVRSVACDLCVLTMSELRNFNNDSTMTLYNGITRYKEYDLKIEFDKGKVKDYYQQVKEGCRKNEPNKLFYIICCKHDFRDSSLSVIWDNNIEIVYLSNLLDHVVFDIAANDGINFEQTFSEIMNINQINDNRHLDRYMRFKCPKSKIN